MFYAINSYGIIEERVKNQLFFNSFTAEADTI